MQNVYTSTDPNYGAVKYILEGHSQSFNMTKPRNYFSQQDPLTFLKTSYSMSTPQDNFILIDADCTNIFISRYTPESSVIRDISSALLRIDREKKIIRLNEISENQV